MTRHDKCECGAQKDIRSSVCRTCFTNKPEPEAKACTKCKKEYPIDHFSIRPNGRGGTKRRSECKPCGSAIANEYRKNNPEKHNASKRKWEKSNPDRVARISLRTRAKQLGLDPDEIEKHFESHNGQCDICHLSAEEVGKKRLSIDHCHSSGKFRGLLCPNCNTALGMFRDNKENLSSAMAYLDAL